MLDLMWPEGEESLSDKAVDAIEKILVFKVKERFTAKGWLSRCFVERVLISVCIQDDRSLILLINSPWK